jgi:hypothetical protein
MVLDPLKSSVLNTKCSAECIRVSYENMHQLEFQLIVCICMCAGLRVRVCARVYARVYVNACA